MTNLVSGSQTKSGGDNNEEARLVSLVPFGRVVLIQNLKRGHEYHVCGTSYVLMKSPNLVYQTGEILPSPTWGKSWSAICGLLEGDF